MPETDAPRKTSLARRVLGFLITILTLGLAAGLITGGTSLIAQNATVSEDVAEASAITVATQPVVLQDSYEVTVRYRGQIEAGQRVDLGFEAGGTLTEVLVDEGDRVVAGAVLARLDTRALSADREAQLASRDALGAQLELARRTEIRQRELAARNHASTQRLDEAELTVARLEAELRRAEAAIVSLDIALDKAVLRAPFDARIGDRFADPGARLSPGAPIAELYEDISPRLRVGLPESLAAGLSPGDTISVELGDAVVTAELTRTRDDIDPTTRTRDLIFALPDETREPDGRLATLSMTRTVEGHGAWIPVTALSEGLRGLWTVFIVEDGAARREAVEVLHTEGERAFVRGHLHNGTAVVSTAPHRIADGQAVAGS